MKIKPLTIEQITISLDRITRFKNPETKYLRVFKDIITHNLISPALSKQELDRTDYTTIKIYAQEILNYSIKKISSNESKNYTINKKILEYERSTFNLDSNTLDLIDNNINYNDIIDFLSTENISNLCWLKSLSLDEDIKILRQKNSFKYPIEILVLVEGATEETLLPEFSKLCNFDFSKNGVYVLPAGGKNQVVKYYYEYSKYLQIPIFILLDSDGIKNAQEISHKLLPKDCIYTIRQGEFEDILPEKLIKETLTNALENISALDLQINNNASCRVSYLEDIFKKRGLHEFKKVEFAQMIKSNLTTSSDLTPEIREIIDLIHQTSNNRLNMK